MSETVIIAMSGGVDSSVAAYLLKEQGYNVIGVTMQIWEARDVGASSAGTSSAGTSEAKSGCCGLTATEDARFVAHSLGIPHYVLNFRDIFKRRVIDYFAEEYIGGKTPNPCIACNRYVKWEYLFKRRIDFGAKYVSTGHYSTIKQQSNGRLAIVASDSPKDQSYALYNLSQEQLSNTIFPLGDMDKAEVRRIAAEQIGLRVAHKPDSQEICFIPNKDHSAFLEKHLGRKLVRGNFVDENGNTLGEHEGIGRYTIGQRKGLGAFGTPKFVKSIDPVSRNIVLAEDSALFSRNMAVGDLNFMAEESIEQDMECFAKIRYSHKASPANIRFFDGHLHCVFDEAQRAITPGQSAVFYRADGSIICGGIIL